MRLTKRRVMLSLLPVALVVWMAVVVRVLRPVHVATRVAAIVATTTVEDPLPAPAAPEAVEKPAPRRRVVPAMPVVPALPAVTPKPEVDPLMEALKRPVPTDGPIQYYDPKLGALAAKCPSGKLGSVGDVTFCLPE